jgi:hypothetical protein
VHIFAHSTQELQDLISRQIVFAYGSQEDGRTRSLLPSVGWMMATMLTSDMFASCCTETRIGRWRDAM